MKLRFQITLKFLCLNNPILVPFLHYVFYVNNILYLKIICLSASNLIRMNNKMVKVSSDEPP